MPENTTEAYSTTPVFDAFMRELVEDTAAPQPESTHYALVTNLDDHLDLLEQAYLFLTRRSEQRKISSSGVEWFLDNYPYAVDAIELIEEDLPEDFFRKLPGLPGSGNPRIFEIARKMVEHFQVDLVQGNLNQTLTAYQRYENLRMSELWAFPLMLRLVLVQILTQTVTQLISERPEKLFSAHNLALKDIQVAALDTDEVIARVLRTLILFDQTDWKKFFERHASVEKILQQDPARVYAKMNFETRDQYRNVIEHLADRSPLDEIEITRKAIELAQSGAAASPKTNHVGYYLLDDGLEQLKTAIRYQSNLRETLRTAFFDAAAGFYIGGILLITIIVTLGLTLLARHLVEPVWQWLLLGFLGIIPASSLAVNLINTTLTTSLSPRILPKMDFTRKIPREFRTVIAIPAMLTSDDEVDFLLGQLERHYLANQDPNLGFVLLTDFADAPQKSMPEDAPLLDRAIAGIENLNQRYQGQRGQQPFFLIHRLRQWNEREDTWMGWERKRGKLADFNRYLLEGFEKSFDQIIGDLKFLKKVRFVITLDSDTLIPREAAVNLIATLAHPLNRAEFEGDTNRVTSGYTILQPRTEVQPTSVNQSFFTRVFAGDLGLDLYTRAVSDVYMDLLGEGIYVGKGIYDVAAFERSLRDKVPQNALLSHDLFEGLQGRAALVSDVVFFEDYPPDYPSQVHRLHRWVRGDWQLLPWLFSKVPTAKGDKENTPFDAIDRWRILDNLRRSLLSPFTLFALVAGWLLIPQQGWLWTLVILFVTAFSLVRNIVSSFTSRILTGGRKSLFANIQNAFYRWFLWLVFLPYESTIMLDAIGTTWVRLYLSHKRLLQWQTAAHTVRIFGKQRKVSASWQRMINAPLLSLAIGLLLLWLNPDNLVTGLPILLLWVMSPQIAFWISQRWMVLTPTVVSEKDLRVFRRIARRTWLYFERFIGPEDHWLPPDHFQEDPRGVVAHRTSPTNIGMLMLSTLSAYDLGYIGVQELQYRTRYTFDTLDDLEKYRGHLLNWYDTQTLQTLSPRYVSTVDSGNFAACLIGLRQTLLAIPDHSLHPATLLIGISDTLDVFCELVQQLDLKQVDKLVGHLSAYCENFRQEVAQGQGSDSRIMALINDAGMRLTELMNDLIGQIQLSDKAIQPEALQNLRYWSEAIFQQLRNIHQQIEQMTPWLEVWQSRPDFLSDLQDDDLRQALHFWFEDGALALPLRELAVQSQLTADYIDMMLAQDPDLSAFGNLGFEQQTIMAAWLSQFSLSLRESYVQASSLLDQAAKLAEICDFYLERMEFGFLFDDQREVFFLGYQVGSGRLDRNHYDLLASEARTASLVAIADNQVPSSHWLHLSRPFTSIDGLSTLISWNGSMFEYLMPNLFTRTYPGTLLDETAKGVVRAQIDYAQSKKVPWGISESSYYRFDAADNYQYQGFGVPVLGRKRGLGNDLVIAPYASLMAVDVDPVSVLKNIHALEKIGALGPFGFYESIDFTETRLPIGQDRAIVKTYMAHHQGMILVALGNYVNEVSIVDRIHNDPRIASTELLLQEQLPKSDPAQKARLSPSLSRGKETTSVSITPWQVYPRQPGLDAHILSNGHLRLLQTGSGSGYLSHQDLALTRWRPDATLDPWGIWFYIQDLAQNDVWSVGLQPIDSTPDEYRVFFAPHQTEIRRVQNGLRVNLLSTISPEEDVCIQKLTLTNQADEARCFRVVSYGEVALAHQNQDQRHPAFNKLFIESQYDSERKMLYFQRRLRSASEKPRGMAHLVFDSLPGKVEHETDRKAFIGRNRDLADPIALSDTDQLQEQVGITLDPIFALGRRVSLNPHETIEIAFITFYAPTVAAAESLADQFRDPTKITNTFLAAEAQSGRLMRSLNLTSSLLNKFDQLLSRVIYPIPELRDDPTVLSSNTLSQSGLWAFGISGDHPILLVEIDREEEIETLQEALLAHAYWRKMATKIDLVILNTRDTGYTHALNEKIHRVINSMGSGDWVNQRGGIFVLTASQMENEALTLLKTAAAVLIDFRSSNLGSHLRRTAAIQPHLPPFTAIRPRADFDTGEALSRPQDWIMDNGIGGFTADGREYQIYLTDSPETSDGQRQVTPAPWINVIANELFGFFVTESGGGYSWAINSGENRLTPWTNDPVSDPSGESLYLRDEMTGAIWSPTPYPAGSGASHLIRHGQGYSIFESIQQGFRHQLTLFTPPDDPVKVIALTLENLTDEHRRLTATYFAEWVLGVNRSDTQSFIVPEFDVETGSLLARNSYSAEFASRVAFLTSNLAPHGLTTDRREFLGERGNREKPRGLQRIGLSGTVMAGLDPCAALQTHLNFEPREKKEVVFVLGQGADRAESIALAKHYSQPDGVRDSYQRTVGYWEDLCTTLTVSTPEPSFDIILNRWLPYQTLSCRLWGRSAFYQSSGAYGFRDQLQDVMAMLIAQPVIARDQILRAAQHQFEAGDVLHWWHPPSGRGVRTRITDDLLWLVYVTAEYLRVTGDDSILEEKIAFRRGEPLDEGEDERYGNYALSEETFSLLEHLQRALTRGDTSGPHRLPLIGGGDWNDGMNRVGLGGQGESVWLGWFLLENHNRFAEICERRQQFDLAQTHRDRALAIAEAIENEAWDGAWWRRAYYDDGTPIGSRLSAECKIDSLPQSWSVLTGAGRADRQRQAIDALKENLVQSEDRLIRLFTPPFDQTGKDPGYIKGYPPGIRENGGQYTHGAIWAVWAIAALGEGDEAFRLFQFLNPITHSRDLISAHHYQLEPYVVAADIYSVGDFAGVGGWSWYTGSAGWLYRLGTEALLGLKKHPEHLSVDPCIPEAWDGFSLVYRHADQVYRISVENPNHTQTGVQSIWCDGVLLDNRMIPLRNDQQDHEVRILMG